MGWLFMLPLFLGALCQNPPHVIPPTTVEAIYPKGLRVSIPDNGYTFFAFHGNVNQKMSGFEVGQWNRDYVKPKNGRWIFQDANVELNIGDFISYWLFVEKDGIAYKVERMYTIREYAVGGPIPIPVEPPPTGFPCPISSTLISDPGFVCKGQLLFEDRFNVLVPRRWKPEIIFPGEPDLPFNVYSDEAISYKGGNLIISAIHNHRGILDDSVTLAHRCTGKFNTSDCTRHSSDGNLPHVMTGKITSKHKFSFKFGRIEVRAKMPAGDWLVPEINLEPLENSYGSCNYSSGIIRVAFVKGNLQFAKQLYAGPVLASNQPYRSMLMKQKIGDENWSYDFHNYTLVWNPDGLDLYVDGDQYGHIPADWITRKDAKVPVQRSWLDGSLMAPLDRLFYLSIGLRVGGLNDFEDSPNKPWKDGSTRPETGFWKAKELWLPTWISPELTVDYIRVYAL